MCRGRCHWDCRLSSGRHCLRPCRLSPRCRFRFLHLRWRRLQHLLLQGGPHFRECCSWYWARRLRRQRLLLLLLLRWELLGRLRQSLQLLSLLPLLLLRQRLPPPH